MLVLELLFELIVQSGLLELQLVRTFALPLPPDPPPPQLLSTRENTINAKLLDAIERMLIEKKFIVWLQNK